MLDFIKPILETIRNSEIRLNEYITGKDKNLDCVKHLNNHLTMNFGGLFCPVPTKTV